MTTRNSANGILIDLIGNASISKNYSWNPFLRNPQLNEFLRVRRVPFLFPVKDLGRPPQRQGLISFENGKGVVLWIFISALLTDLKRNELRRESCHLSLPPPQPKLKSLASMCGGSSYVTGLPKVGARPAKLEASPTSSVFVVFRGIKQVCIVLVVACRLGFSHPFAFLLLESRLLHFKMAVIDSEECRFALGCLSSGVEFSRLLSCPMFFAC